MGAGNKRFGARVSGPDRAFKSLEAGAGAHGLVFWAGPARAPSSSLSCAACTGSRRPAGQKTNLQTKIDLKSGRHILQEEIDRAK